MGLMPLGFPKGQQQQILKNFASCLDLRLHHWYFTTASSHHGKSNWWITSFPFATEGGNWTTKEPWKVKTPTAANRRGRRLYL